ncbi:MAG: hypothetical protein AAGE52_05325 [Myxococcota bacterium]
MTRAVRATPAVCTPLGFGARGAPTTIHYAGETYDVIPFRIEAPGIRVIDRGRDVYTIVCAPPRGTDVMIRKDHGLADQLREPISVEGANHVLSILLAPDEVVDAWEPLPTIFSREAARVCRERNPEPIARLLRRIRKSTHLAFGDHQIVRALSGVLLHELAHVLERPIDDLRRSLAERVGRPW